MVETTPGLVLKTHHWNLLKLKKKKNYIRTMNFGVEEHHVHLLFHSTIEGSLLDAAMIFVHRHCNSSN